MSLSVGPVQNGKQSITISDANENHYQTVISTPEKVDEFVKSYYSISKNDNKKSWLAVLLTGIAGATIGYLSKIKETPIMKTELGALFGLCVGAVLSFVIPEFSAHKQEKLAQKFLAENS